MEKGKKFSNIETKTEVRAPVLAVTEVYGLC